MVTRFGMSERMGHLTYGKPLAGRFLQVPTLEERNYSDKTAEEIDEEVHRLVNDAFERARSILSPRRTDLKLIAHELISKETLDRPMLDKLIRDGAELFVNETSIKE
jgi:cell division protease FtsH